MFRSSLPRFVSTGSLSTMMAHLLSLFRGSDEEIYLDCSQFEFADPMGLCLLRYHLDLVTYLDCVVHIENLSDEWAAYFEKMNFFTGLTNVHCANRPTPASRVAQDHVFVEVTKIDSELSIDVTAGRLAAAIVGASSAPAEADPDGMTASPADRLHHVIQYILSELINNAAFHGAARGFKNREIWVAAQYYKHSDSVRLAILDNGCGFLESLRDHSALQEPTHESAISAALTPRVSCNRDLARGLDSGNQGLGLSVSKALTIAAGGRIDVFSGDAWYRATAQTTQFRPLNHNWQGVGIAMRMLRNRLQEIEISRTINEVAPVRERRAFNFE
ncbi:hypothetical protein WL92_25830 [Burkholderia multivorans]|uniref:ATP-binding protein n=1 Tax=Burkholderia multivorans TaxID=87883 RepID=UPI000755AD91|nr:ATP-binding protein [Burkholderia multivorans]KWF68369.1 hypothetical protein WL91_16460 [Burkholderia multivorans]KWF74928.1 hypothetical protein WL92_25830 [Burkholderia multivorans]